MAIDLSVDRGGRRDRKKSSGIIILRFLLIIHKRPAGGAVVLSAKETRDPGTFIHKKIKLLHTNQD
jgi:hypothetical protein